MENSEETTTEEDTLEVEKFGDETIAIIRELMQLALITGTNIVDHLRAVEVVKDEDTGKLVPTEDYVIAYNSMIDEIAQKAQEAQDAEDARVAAEADGPELELPSVASDSEDAGPN